MVDEAHKLIERGGALSEFGSRIDVAFGVGLIGADERIALQLVRKVRNQFAHDANLFRFEHDERVRGWCEGLKLGGEPPDLLLHQVFAFAAAHYELRLRNRLPYAESQKRAKFVWKDGVPSRE